MRKFTESQQDVPWKLNTKFFLNAGKKKKKSTYCDLRKKVLFFPEVEITINAEEYFDLFLIY